MWIERRPRRVSASILAAAPTSFEAARLPNSAPPPLSYAPGPPRPLFRADISSKTAMGSLAYVYGKEPDRISASQL